MDIALILGMVIGGGALTKTNAFFSIYLLPFSLLLFDWSKKTARSRLLRWVGLCLISVMLTYGIYSVLRLSPFFHIIDEKNAIFVYPFKEWLNHPFEFFIGNMRAFLDWISRYLTWPLLSIAFLSFFLSKTFTREKITLLLWFILPIIALGFFGRTLYPRFIFFMILPLLSLIAYSLENIYLRFNKTYLFVIFCFLFFFLAFKTDYLILTDFTKANIPGSDINQYLASWPAGGGIKESVEFFEREAKKGKIYIATEGTFGLMPYAYEIYLVNNPNIKIEGYWPIGDVLPAKVTEESKKIPTYFVFYQSCDSCIGTEAPRTWPLTQVLKIKKGEDGSYLTVYKVNKI